MGGYELEGNMLYYSGDGMSEVKLTDRQVKLWKQRKLDPLKLNWISWWKDDTDEE